MRFTFKKSERLHSKILIGKLFSEGSSFFIHPFRVSYLIVEKNEEPPVQIIISVSKKNFKSAVKRNKIKRLIRESYRINKHMIWDEYIDRHNEQLLLGLVYVGKTIVPYSEMERKLILILHRLIDKDA